MRSMKYFILIIPYCLYFSVCFAADFTLKGIVSIDGKHSAIINDTVVREGDYVETATVDKITDNYVELLNGNKKITLKLNSESNNNTQKTRSPDQSDFKSKEFINLVINPTIELDFKNKREILDLRKRYVLQYPQLIKGNYIPSEAVFGQIQDKKPWWGTLGLSFYGDGQDSIKGNSEESRFIANPFLLVGIDECAAHKRLNLQNAIELYPKPVELSWSTDKTIVKATYKVSDFFQKDEQYGCPTIKNRGLDLIAYNARDMGYNYLYFDPRKSENIGNYSNEAVPIIQYIHCGGSCGYPGGCNNMSPTDPHMSFNIIYIPAVIHLKLWKQKPANPDKQADMEYVIKMI